MLACYGWCNPRGSPVLVQEGDTQLDRYLDSLGGADEDVEVTGPATVKLWASSSATDTDFTAKLLYIYPPSPDYPDGYHLNVCEGIIRARYRDGSGVAKLLEPGEVYACTIILEPTSTLFKAGHRIRLDISSSNFPRFDVNPNAGEPMGSKPTQW